ncbi:hypothetical protein [Flectobacillus sp.]|uniref:hypothetical protein n=1 Tax=Flectobacillus sp. TaxID=50419 RepID=UPI003BAADB0B
MKKIILLGFAISCLQLESEASVAEHKSSATHISATTIKSTYKRRRKKGFLWGLFRKKDCGCPKH